MLIRYDFTNGDVVISEVNGEIKDYYLELSGIKPEKTPDSIHVSVLDERIGRKHSRAHKYTGLPVSYEVLSENGEQIKCNKEDFLTAEVGIDLSRALGELTNIQRYCFIEVCINGKTHREVADELRKPKYSVTQAINGARKKLKKHFLSYAQNGFSRAIK